MLAIRRLSMRFRNQGLSLWTTRICYGKSDIGGCCETYIAESVVNQKEQFNGVLSSQKLYSSSSYGNVWCNFSSQAGAKSSGEEVNDLEDGIDKETTSEDESDDDVVSSKQELSEEDDVFDDVETDADGDEVEKKKKMRKPLPISEMTKVILAALSSPVAVRTIMNKWVEEGNNVTQEDLSSAMFHLRRRKLFNKALQLSEWLISGKHLDLSERHYKSHIDLIAKVRGIFKAEEYLYSIPKSFQGERVYRTLLANCVSATNMKKSEEVFNKMKELSIPISCFTCNQLLLLYKKTDSRKISYVLRLMEEEKVKPSLFTYQILINVKGQANDIKGMEQLMETLKTEGFEPNSQILASLARHYASSGLKDKAYEILKQMEGDDLVKNRWSCCMMLPVYAYLGNEDEVERIWKFCEPNPRLYECMAAIEAWGHLNKVDNAEAAFEKLLERVNKPSTKHIAVMLQVYANHKMLTKGTDLVKRMSEIDCRIGPLAWDGLVKLYIGADEVEKAGSVIERGVEEKQGRPLFSTYVRVMEKYSEKGDIHNAEKMFHMMKQGGYKPGPKQYHSLLDAYINAKVSVYGFADRMRADNIFPNKALAAQLARSDPFKKTVL